MFIYSRQLQNWLIYTCDDKKKIDNAAIFTVSFTLHKYYLSLNVFFFFLKETIFATKRVPATTLPFGENKITYRWFQIVEIGIGTRKGTEQVETSKSDDWST